MLVLVRRLPVPEPPPYESGAGLNYARDLAQRGQAISFLFLLIGWLCVVSGGLLALMGTTARTEFEVHIERSSASPTETSAVGAASAGEEPLFQILRLRSGMRNWVAAHIGLILGAFAIIFAGIGWQLLDRATAASLLAAAATKSIEHASTGSDDNADLQAYKACVDAKIAWLEGRLNHDRIGSISSGLIRDQQRSPKQADAAKNSSPPG